MTNLYYFWLCVRIFFFQRFVGIKTTQGSYECGTIEQNRITLRPFHGTHQNSSIYAYTRSVPGISLFAELIVKNGSLYLKNNCLSIYNKYLIFWSSFRKKKSTYFVGIKTKRPLPFLHFRPKVVPGTRDKNRRIFRSLSWYILYNSSSSSVPGILLFAELKCEKKGL